MKKIFRPAAILLCLCLLLSMAAFASGEPSGEASGEASAEASGEASYEISYSSLALDTVVGSVNGEDVTWSEYYYWIAYYVQYFQSMASSYGFSLSSWDAYELSADMTNAELVLAQAQYSIEEDHVITDNLAAMGYTSDMVVDELDANMSDAADSYGDGDGEVTEDELDYFLALLDQSGLDTETYLYLNAMDLLSEDAFVDVYGENGENCPDDVVDAYIADNGLMSAKHILLTTINTETNEPYSDDVAEIKYAEAENILARLQTVRDDPEALEAMFDELMPALTEDTGIANYPDGYVFGDGEMIAAFEDAVKGLDENYGLSDIVESDYGYHIILRTPVAGDSVIYDSDGNAYSIRYIAASQAFSDSLYAGLDDVRAVWNDGFDAASVINGLFY